MIRKVVEAIQTREEESGVEVMVEEEEDGEGLMVLVITKEEKLRKRPRRTTLRLNAGDATRWDTLCHIVLHD